VLGSKEAAKASPLSSCKLAMNSTKGSARDGLFFENDELFAALRTRNRNRKTLRSRTQGRIRIFLPRAKKACTRWDVASRADQPTRKSDVYTQKAVQSMPGTTADLFIFPFHWQMPSDALVISIPSIFHS
jgi:hypothetical protein